MFTVCQKVMKWQKSLKFFAVFLTLPIVVSTCKARNRKSKIQNIDLADGSHPVDEQGPIGSCTSFSVLAIVESHLFQKTGVSVRLSQRFQLRNVLIDNDDFAKADRRQLDAINKWGILPDEQYSYKDIKFQNRLIDAQQLPYVIKDFELDNIVDYWDTSRALHKLKLGSSERIKFLNSKDLFDLPPQGSSGDEQESETVAFIPAPAIAIKDRKLVPTVENTPCFIGSNETIPIERKAISAVNFAKHCMLFDVDLYGYLDAESNRPLLQKKVMSSLDRREAVAFGFEMSRYPTSLWTYADENIWRSTKTGHSSAIVGYISAEELANSAANEQSYLSTNAFERLDLLMDLSIGKLHDGLLGPTASIIDALSASAAKEFRKLEVVRESLVQEMKHKQSKIAQYMWAFGDSEWIGWSAIATEVANGRTISSKVDQIDESKMKLIHESLTSQVADEWFERMNIYFEAKKLKSKQYLFEVIPHPTKSGKLAAIVKGHPEWIIKESSDLSSNESGADRSQRRLKLPLGQIIKKERGIFFIRNSWGNNLGIDGYYFMTFLYFDAYVKSILSIN